MTNQQDLLNLLSDVERFMSVDLASVQLPPQIQRKRNDLVQTIKSKTKHHTDGGTNNNEQDAQVDEITEYEEMPDITNKRSTGMSGFPGSRLSAAEVEKSCVMSGYMMQKKKFKKYQYWCSLNLDGMFFVYGKEDDPIPLLSLKCSDYSVSVMSSKKSAHTLLDFSPKATAHPPKGHQFIASDAERWATEINTKFSNKSGSNSTPAAPQSPVFRGVLRSKGQAPPPPATKPPAEDDDEDEPPQEIYGNNDEEEGELADYDEVHIPPASSSKPSARPTSMVKQQASMARPSSTLRPPSAFNDDGVEDIYDTVQDSEPGTRESLFMEEEDPIDTYDDTLTVVPAAREYLDLYYAKYSPKDQVGKSDELVFDYGDVIRVTDKKFDTDGWWIGELRGRVGLVPKSFLKPVYVKVRS